MDSIKKSLDKRPIMSQIVKYLLIALGSAVGAVGFQLFMQPNSIVSGGLTGIAQIINRLTGLPVGVLSIAMNVPLFIAAARISFSARLSALFFILCSSILPP